MNNQSERTIGIIGMGLIGGSLGLALCRFSRLNKKHWRVIGMGRGRKSLELAKRRRACHEISMDWVSGVSRVDDLVICTPPAEIIPTLIKVHHLTSPGTVISDVGSVKFPIVEKWQSIKKSGRPAVFFVGAHPMAGLETSGIEHAGADLFKGTVCALTPCPGEPSGALERVEALWKSCGTHPIRLQAQTHDRIVALTSHLPHLLASGLVLSLVKECSREPLTRRFVAGSFLDLTRVAASDARMWSEIFHMNRNQITAACHLLLKSLNRLRSGKEGAIEELLNRGASFRRQWSR